MSDHASAQLPKPAPPVIDHLSWSAIKTYSTCARKFAFHYCENAPKEFVPASLLFGSCFHSAVEHLHQRRLEGAERPDEDEALDVYREHWSWEVEEIRYGKNEDTDSLCDLAERMLWAYCKYLSERKDHSQIIAIEHATRFQLLEGIPAIEPHLDLIEMDGTDLVICDLKTSKGRWNQQKIQEATPQLVVYSAGLIPLKEALDARRIVTRFVVVTKAKKPVVQIVEATPTATDEAHLRQTIAESWQAIQAGVFPRRESWACEQCPLRKQCLG